MNTAQSIVLKNLPSGTVEADIRRALMPFGTVLELNYFPSHAQAVVKMQTSNEANALTQRGMLILQGSTVMVESAAGGGGGGGSGAGMGGAAVHGGGFQPYQPAQQRGGADPQRHATPGYAPSGGGGVRMPPSMQQQQGGAMHLHHHQTQQQSQPQHQQYGGSTGGYGGHASSGGHSMQQSVAGGGGGGYQSAGGGSGGYAPTTIQIQIMNVAYPVSDQVLYDVFKDFGQVVHIHCPQTTVEPGGVLTAMVQFADASSAEQAVAARNGFTIYPNANVMHITLSMVSAVSMQQQQQQSHHTQGGYQQQGMMQPPSQHQQHQSGAFNNQPTHQGYGLDRGGMGRGRGRGGYGDGPAGGRGFTPYGDRGGGPGQNVYGGRGGGPPMGMAGGPPPGGYGGEGAPVITLSNVAPEASLFNVYTLLELYGNVVWLKRQHSNTENVMCKFTKFDDAKCAAQFVDGCPFFHKTLRARLYPTFIERGMPPAADGNPEDPECKEHDFTFAQHRSRPNSNFPLKRFRPSEHLFLAGITEIISVDDVRNAFEQHGYKVARLYRKNATTGLLSFNTLEDSVNALLKVHNHVTKGRAFRLMFAGFPPPAEGTPEWPENGDGPPPPPGTVPTPQPTATPPAPASAAAAGEATVKVEGQQAIKHEEVDTGAQGPPPPQQQQQQQQEQQQFQPQAPQQQPAPQQEQPLQQFRPPPQPQQEQQQQFVAEVPPPPPQQQQQHEQQPPAFPPQAPPAPHQQAQPPQEPQQAAQPMPPAPAQPAPATETPAVDTAQPQVDQVHS